MKASGAASIVLRKVPFSDLTVYTLKGDNLLFTEKVHKTIKNQKRKEKKLFLIPP